MKDGSNGRIEEQKRLETKKKRHLNCRCKSNYINDSIKCEWINIAIKKQILEEWIKMI